MRTGPRTRFRQAARAAAAAAVLALLCTTGPIPPGSAVPRSVDATDFPGVRQVAEILPEYDGGARHLEDDHAVWVFRRNCLSYRDGPAGEVRAWAYYYPASGDAPSYPRFHVQEFATVDDAKQAIRTIRRNAERCYGTYHRDDIDGTFIRRPADVPSLGDGRPAAWKMNDRWTDDDTGVERVYYSRRIWMREAETVIGVDLWGEAPQSRRASIRLARLVLRTVG
ncbi:hypothetical protein [Nocardioides antri]|uniref:PknH-like extracellular domain-containing protein n=1 Tax=Nocardioides antri TaxID=2607659 RepID=A0A5B1LZL8_9ACTN|nr:hypothetical protein [Nocardioides antri]KAA1426001.1 hypothetical protein F0U47_16840 [Nocardioides antri]